MRRNSSEIKPTVLIILALALTGCTVNPIVERPPVELLWDCPIPEIKARTNGELASTAKALHGALVLCNIDKAALRAWAN